MAGASFVLASLAFGQGQGMGQHAIDLVDPVIGTANEGNVFPGASWPFGMIQWSPDTADGWYHHDDTRIHGFGLTHLSGAGCPLLADMPLLPWSGSPPANLDERPSQSVAFSHQDEVSRPGYYSVRLNTGTIVELTVTERAGLARIRFAPGAHAGLLLNGAGSANTDADGKQRPAAGRELDGESLTVRSGNIVTGTVTSGGFCGTPTHYTLHVAYETRNAPRAIALWQNGQLIAAGSRAEGRRAAAWLDMGDRREQYVRVGLSFVSEEKALANLHAEMPDWDFDGVRAKAAQAWESLLDRVEVSGGTALQRKAFYTGLYHNLLSPTLFDDRDGEYAGFDGKVHRVEAPQMNQYANFSDWDIYRDTVQLQAWLLPAQASDMAQSLVNDASQLGSLPRWGALNDSTYVMGGDSPSLVIAGYSAFGAQGFDRRAALAWMKRGALTPGLGSHNRLERAHLDSYLRLGYSPIDSNAVLGDRSVSETLEYNSADFAISRFARSLGDEATAKLMERHAGGWRKLVDPQTRWLRPRAADGTWLAGFDPERSLPRRVQAPESTDQSGFEEGNTYQYTFMIPFDYEGLFDAIGDQRMVEQRLDRFFTHLACWGEPCFNMANEPDFVTPYAYTFLGKPWKTAAVLTRIEDETFGGGPDGLPGNDDLGATSGVYVWNMMGLYPAIPGVGGVVLGSPRFTRTTLHLGGGQILGIERTGEGIYVQSVALNGEPWRSSWLALDKLLPGMNTLAFTMSTEANQQWATQPAELPPSLSKP